MTAPCTYHQPRALTTTHDLITPETQVRERLFVVYTLQAHTHYSWFAAATL